MGVGKFFDFLWDNKYRVSKRTSCSYATKEYYQLRKKLFHLMEQIEGQEFALERAYVSMRRMRWYEGTPQQKATFLCVQKILKKE